MRQVSRKAAIRPASCFFLFCFASILGFAFSPTAIAQERANLASSGCVPSDLNALIVSGGPTVHVGEAPEGFGRKGSAARPTDFEGFESSESDIQKGKQAYKIFLTEARQGNPAAMVNLAVASLAGWDAKPNAGAALYWLHAAADQGYGAAFYDLGILYFKGCGVSRDAAEAFHYFDLGARAGYSAAQVNLGYFYDHGLGVAQDAAAAAQWYRKAAELGNAQAQYNLGDLYLHGEGVPKDEPAAFAWYQKAALQGHTGARIMAGSMLAAGRGTSKDLAGAYFWVFAGVLQGDARGVPLLRTLEGQLPAAEIEEAKERARLLVAGAETAKNR